MGRFSIGSTPTRRTNVLPGRFNNGAISRIIAVRTATILEIAPLLNLPGRTFVLRVGVDPIENLPISQALLQLLEQSLRVDSQKGKDMLIQRAVEMKLAVFVNQSG